MSRTRRAVVVALGTVVLVALGCMVPAMARADAWPSAIWTVPVLAWLPREARFPVLGGIALTLAVVVVWRMTLAADARTPRMRIGAIAPLLAGPRGFRTPKSLV